MNQQIMANLHSWAKGICKPPETIQIYPTNKCNLACVFCYQQQGKYNLEEDVERIRWLEVAKELCKMNVKNILISGGGEPLASKVTIDLIELFKKKNIHGRMIHNGTLWTTALIKRAVKSGWDHIIFSIDGAKAETHDFLRRKKGSFSRIVHNLKEFDRIKREFHSQKPILESTTVLTSFNFHEIPNFVIFADSMHIKNITVEPVCTNNAEVEKIKLNKAQRNEFLEKILPKAEKLANERNISTNFYKLYDVKIIEKTGNLKKEILRKKKNNINNGSEKMLPDDIKKFIESPCFEPWLWPKIEANGEVWPCSTVPLKENIKERSFREIWYGMVFNKFREQILSKKLDDSCNNCVLTHLHTFDEIRTGLREAYLVK